MIDEGLAMCQFAYYGITTAEDEKEAAMITEELKPCPFCGFSKASIKLGPPMVSSDVARGWVECEICSAVGPSVSSDISEDEARLLAATLWNLRRESKNTPERQR